MSEPKVSVLMLVYDHGEFVAQAIEGVLAQECGFSYELILVNDHSSDNSGSICQSYADQHPELITFVDNSVNQGMHTSFEQLWNASKADLVAFCEGDDLWIDNSKLRSQVALMDENPHWALCGAKAQVIELSKSGSWEVASCLGPLLEKKEYRFDELIESYHFHFSTVIMRKPSVKFPDWFKSTYCVDRPIYLLAAENGLGGFLNQIVSSYRIHPKGNWSSISSLSKAEKSRDLFMTLSRHFPVQYEKKFSITLFNILQSYVAKEMHGQRYPEARQIFNMAFGQLAWLDKLRCFKDYYRTAILLMVRR